MRSNPKNGCVLLALTVAVVISIVTAPSQAPPPYRAPGTQRMAERLESIAQNARPEKNPRLNAERVEYFRSGLNRPLDPYNRVMLRALVAQELLYAGKTGEAIEEFLYVQREVDQKRFRFPSGFAGTIRDLLAISYFRQGEQENCIDNHTIEACLLPIGKAGVHGIQRGSRAAIQAYKAILNEKPDDLTSRWLLNIAYMTVGEYPDLVPEKWLIPPKVFASDYDIGRFYDVAPGLGLDVVGLAGGSIMEDFNGDGYLDIVASSWALRHQIRYFRNEGDGTFTERTEDAGLKGLVGGLNIVQADYNNDGYPDVLVLRGGWMGEDGRHPNSLLRNNGDGTFDDVTEEAGLLTLHPTQTAAWGDYDNDGWVDLFIGNESADKVHPCELFRNNGDGTFIDVAEAAGVDVASMVKGVVWGDYNNDGLLDLYISSFLAPNRLFMNNGKNEFGRWTFADVSESAGVSEPLYSFPAWFWDYDNDGWQDIFVPGYRATSGEVAADYLGLPADAERPRLYRNNHDGTFTDVTKETRLYKVMYVMGCNFGDLDHDGFLDFYVGTGDPDFREIVPNRMFRNAGGEFFQDVTTSGGFGHLQKGHGVAFGDLDNDGDQDIYVVIGGAYTGDVFQNVLFENPGHGNHWITLKLEGVQSNRAAIGVRIKIGVNTEKGSRDIYATVTTGGSFGGSSLQQEIGLGQATSIRSVEITWPATGRTQIFKDVAMDRVYQVREGDPLLIPVTLKRFDLSPEAAGQAGSSHSYHH